MEFLWFISQVNEQLGLKGTWVQDLTPTPQKKTQKQKTSYIHRFLPLLASSDGNLDIFLNYANNR